LRGVCFALRVPYHEEVAVTQILARCLVPPLLALLAACGGGGADDRAVGTPVATMASVPPMRTQALSATEAADAVMDFGEQQFPGYFPSHQPSQSLPPFRYRHYPQTGIYLGVVVSADAHYALEGVYVMGGEFGAAPLRVGAVRDFVDPGGAPPECAADACLLLAQRKSCMACHSVDKKLVGPSLRDIANRYASTAGAADYLAGKIRGGSVGVWGPVPMPTSPSVTTQEADLLARWILSMGTTAAAR
jgi:cytochrome c